MINAIDLKERIALNGSFTPEERGYLLEAINATPPQPAVKHESRNYLGRIDQIWAYLSLDEGGEGVCAAPMGNGMVAPLIAADKRRLDDLHPIARNLATMFNKPIRLAKFTAREDVEIIRP